MKFKVKAEIFEHAWLKVSKDGRVQLLHGKTGTEPMTDDKTAPVTTIDKDLLYF